MKNKYIIILFILGFIVTILGALFKITHWQIGIFNGTLLLTIGMLSEISVCLFFVVKLFYNKKDSFLNK